jgi:hypothetical protein
LATAIIALGTSHRTIAGAGLWQHTSGTLWLTMGLLLWSHARAHPGLYPLAAALLAEFHSTEADLNRLDWEAIAATDFRAPEVKEGKQAEFLVHDRFPLELVERIGVHSEPIRAQAVRAISSLARRPAVEVRRDWYF